MLGHAQVQDIKVSKRFLLKIQIFGVEKEKEPFPAIKYATAPVFTKPRITQLNKQHFLARTRYNRAKEKSLK